MNIRPILPQVHGRTYPETAPILTLDDLVGFVEAEAEAAGMSSALLETVRYGMTFALFLLTARVAPKGKPWGHNHNVHT